MKFIDVSQTITNGMKKYHSDPSVEIAKFKSIKSGNSCNLLKLSFGSHAGTHIDAPRHIFNSGAGVDKIDLKRLICKVLVVNHHEFMKPGFFRKGKNGIINGVLFKAGRNIKGISIEEAKLLVKNKMKIVGIEGMSIEDSLDKFHKVHRILLKNKIVIIEGLILKAVKTGLYSLICLPLKIKNGDGSPVRAVLIPVARDL